ncbi:MAG: ABC transporter ATP-binding protein [Gammaproteobacteria bacterium]|nr:ABC transporter ATP-binding protein [Gammaproteobacteria bacterium]
MTKLIVKNISVVIEKKFLIGDLNVEFSSGEIWGILGDNGIGKTSLLYALAGLQKPQKGQILIREDEPQPIFEKNIYDLTIKERARKIGLLFQETHFEFPNSVFDTVMGGRYPYQQHWFLESWQDIEIVKSTLKTMQLEKIFDRSVTQLSGGEKQRAALATLLVQDPDIFLLDEPTNHLDTKQRLRTLSLFQRLAKEHHKIVIMVLHETRLIRKFCDRLLKLDRNKGRQLASLKKIIK